MAGPGDEMAAAASGRMRASHADREQVIEMLKAAFVQGLLDTDELDQRVGQALASRTYADLATLTADLADRPSTAARPPEPARASGHRRAFAAVTCATPVLMGMWLLVRAMPEGTPWPLALPVILVTLVLVLTVPTGWLVLLHEWLEMRAERQSTRGPAAGGPALPGGS
jgi:hypothetical protein